MRISNPITAHGQLGSVTADQHHAESHAMTAAVHTGAISATQHGALGAITSAHSYADIASQANQIENMVEAMMYG